MRFPFPAKPVLSVPFICFLNSETNVKTVSQVVHLSKANQPITYDSLERLSEVLSCYDAEERLALGEVYSYRTSDRLLLPYPTGGSGMVFSRPLVSVVGMW